VTKIPTTAVLSGLPAPPILFDRANRLIFERATPRQKYVVSADWSRGALAVTAGATYYGDIIDPNNSPALDYNVGARTLVDLEGRWASPFGVGVAVGVDNLFDQYPNPTPTNVNTNGPIGFSRFSPYGFNGRLVYARLSYGW
jgi:iron complex outermembrane recepter protein